MSNLVVKSDAELVSIINNLEGRFNDLLGDDTGAKFKQEALFSTHHLKNNDFLMSVAKSNPTSLVDAVLNVATLDVSLNPAEKHAYLIPRKVNKKMCVMLDISYMGLASIAVKSGAVAYMKAEIVKENDTFIMNGVGDAPTHNFSPFKERGSVVGVYCVSKLASGDFITDVMTIEEVYNIRNRSEAYKKGHGPWITDENEMIKKTVVKRAFKLLPSANNYLANAVDYLNTDMGEGINFSAEKEEMEKKELEEINKERERVRLEEKKAREKKQETIDQIKLFCSSICKGKTLDEKAMFLKGELGVNSFTDISSLSEIKLSEMLMKLSRMNKEINSKKTARDNVFTIEVDKK